MPTMLLQTKYLNNEVNFFGSEYPSHYQMGYYEL